MNTTTQSDLDFALRMLGQATVDYAKDRSPAHFENMGFWQNQVWECAKDLASQAN